MKKALPVWPLAVLTLGSPASCSIGIAQSSPDDWHAQSG
jgi:hypothetical protein